MGSSLDSSGTSGLREELLKFFYDQYWRKPNSFIGKDEILNHLKYPENIINGSINYFEEKGQITVEYFDGNNYLVKLTANGIDYIENTILNEKKMLKKNQLIQKIVEEYKKYLDNEYENKILKKIDRISHIILNVSQYKIGINEEDDLSREEFRGAIQRYLWGFYEDSILRATFSLEIALIIKLNKMLTDNEKIIIQKDANTNNRNISFDSLMNLSKKYQLVENEDVFYKMNQISKIRRAHIHPQNYLAATRNIYQQIFNQYPFVKKVIYKIMPSVEKMVQIPKYEWSTSTSTLNFVEKGWNEYFSDLFNNFSILDINEVINNIESHDYFERRANKTLKLSFEILKYLNIF